MSKTKGWSPHKARDWLNPKHNGFSLHENRSRERSNATAGQLANLSGVKAFAASIGVLVVSTQVGDPRAHRIRIHITNRCFYEIRWDHRLGIAIIDGRVNMHLF